MVFFKIVSEKYLYSKSRVFWFAYPQDLLDAATRPLPYGRGSAFCPLLSILTDMLPACGQS